MKPHPFFLNLGPIGLGILYMVASMLCFSLMTAMVRMATFELHPAYIVLLRNASSLAIMLVWVLWREREVLKSPNKRAHFHRALLGILSMEIWFYSLAKVPLPEATALSFVTPLFVTIFAIFFLKEKVGPHRITALILGFVGVLVITRPGMAAISPFAFLVLISSALIAVSSILVKQLTRTESPVTIVYYMALFMTPLSLPLGLPHMESLNLKLAGIIAVIAITSTLAHFLLARAYTLAPVSTLMPFDFSRLIFASIFAYYLFGETLDRWTFAGAAIIVASTFYIAHRERKLRIQTPPPETQD
jgi:drug/metabolite transporter (DMT)-like permease